LGRREGEEKERTSQIRKVGGKQGGEKGKSLNKVPPSSPKNINKTINRFCTVDQGKQ
jgi:hypothetical protein